jgi:hypothetical protein
MVFFAYLAGLAVQPDLTRQTELGGITSYRINPFPPLVKVKI